MRRAVIRTALLMGLMVGMVKVPQVLVAAKYLLVNYAGGYSGAKSFLLLLFLAVLSALAPWPSVWKERWNWSVPTGLGLLYLLSVAEYLYYCRAFGLPLNQRSVLVHQGLQSSTMLGHFHTNKAALAALLPYSGQGFDSGAPFLAVFPRLVLLSHGLLFLVQATAVVAMVHHYQKNMSPERALTLALGVYPLVKGVVDGGPFSVPDAARLALLSWVFLEGFKRKLALGIAGSLGLLSLLIQGTGGVAISLMQAAISLLVLCLPLAWERVRLQGLKPKSALWLGLCLATLLGTPLLKYRILPNHRKPPYPVATWSYGNAPLQAGWVVHIVSPGSLPSTELGEVLDSNEAGRLRVSRLQLKRSTTPFELCRAFGLNVFRQPVVWYQGPGYVEIEGPFEMPPPVEWLHSPLVTRYSFEARHGWTRLVLEMVPGAQTNVACELLPNGPFATRRVDLSYHKPEVSAPWTEVGQP